MDGPLPRQEAGCSVFSTQIEDYPQRADLGYSLNCGLIGPLPRAL